MWKDDYKNSNVWKSAPYLVNANNGAKKCMSCDLVFYASDFPDASEFVDRKLPVCLECFRAKSGKGLEVVALYEGVERRCKECELALTLDNFAYRKTGNKLSDRCRDCVGTYERGE